MDLSLAQAGPRRQLAFMQAKPTAAPKADEDLLRVGRAIEALRRRVGLTQAQAAEAHEKSMSPQYWGMHETGRVPGIFKPAVQRSLIDALNRASGANPALTLDDLAEELQRSNSGDASRLARLARELGVADRGFDPDVREAVFPTREGDVVVRFPGNMTPAGFKDLEEYLAVFLKTKTRDQ